MRVMSEIHSISFLTERGKWNTTKARRWLKKHNLTPIKRVDKVKVNGILTQLRYRIRNPQEFESFSTKKIPKEDINIIIGYYD